MVDRLAARVKAQPDDPQGWARLIRAYGVLGQTARRDAAITEARRLFRDRPDALAAALSETPRPETGTCWRGEPLPHSNRSRETTMDKDRVYGAADKAKGSIKQAAGKVTGDEKLKAEGAADKAKGAVKSAVGGAKDAIRGTSR